MGHTKPETAKVIHARHRAKKAETGKRLSVWIDNETVSQLETLAIQKGWLNESGCLAGKPSMQITLEAVIKAGLKSCK